MTGATMAEAWKVEADAVARRRRWVWIGNGLLGAMCVACMYFATTSPAAAVRAGALIVAGLLFAAMMLWSTVIYMRGVDEQERDANLWSAYAGICVYLFLFAVHFAARLLGYRLPGADWAIFLATMTVVMGVFVWKRFR